MSEKLQEILEEQGVNHSYIIRETKKAIEGEKGKGAITGLKFLAEYAEMGGFDKATGPAGGGQLTGGIPAGSIPLIDAKFESVPSLREGDDKGDEPVDDGGGLQEGEGDPD